MEKIDLSDLLEDIINDRPLPTAEEIKAGYRNSAAQHVKKAMVTHGVTEVVRNVAIDAAGGAGNAVMENPDLFDSDDPLADMRADFEGDAPAKPEAPARDVYLEELQKRPPSGFAAAAARPAWGVVPKAPSVHDLADPACTPPEPPKQDLGKVFADQPDVGEDEAPRIITLPNFSPEEIFDQLDLRNFASLVTLNTSRWGGKVKDKQASEDVALANDAAAAAFETRKNLLAGADAQLKAICKTLDDARAQHYRLTVPWSTTSMEDHGKRSGGRLLPNRLFMEYTTVMAHAKQAMTDALNQFVPIYPALIEEAKKALGKRFDPREYPNAESIRSHFDLSFDFQPIPKGDDFKGLADAQVKKLAEKLNRNLKTMTKNAMEDLWLRMYKAVEKIAERLTSPDKIFHASTIQNLRDIAHLAKYLNVTDDPRVESVRVKIEKHLCANTPEDLRKNGVLRAQVAGYARSILEEMSSCGTSMTP